MLLRIHVGSITLLEGTKVGKVSKIPRWLIILMLRSLEIILSVFLL